jgi:pilus assembly protein CpaC
MTRLCTLALLFIASLPAHRATAQPKVTAQSEATYKVQMEVGETRLVRLSEKIIRVSIADPNVADVRVVTPLQVLLTAKAVGFTHLILWGETDKPLVIAVTCKRNLNALRSQLDELFPKEQIKVSSSGDLVVLSGKVNDLRTPSRLAQVAQLHSKQLANLVEVSGNQQVQLEVRFAEVSRSGMRKMGLNFLWRDPSLKGGMVGSVSALGSQAGQTLKLPGTAADIGPPPVSAPVAGDAFSLMFSTGLSSFPFSTVLSILAQEGLAKVLAEPTLVALSGHDASFHAGGEVPILIAQQLGTVGVQFKKFGILLKFTPTVLGEKTISLKISAEVSEPDVTLGVTLAGFQVPGFRTRNSETTVRLKDGQSFAIAGLLSDNTRSTVKKVPILGEIPILGTLFRSQTYQRDESELLVVVRSVLTQPIAVKDAPKLPGDDEITDPSDFNFFLLGDIGGGKKEKKRRGRRRKDAEPVQEKRSGGPSGPVGFMR